MHRWRELNPKIKAFLRHPGFRVDVDPHALIEYFTFQNFLADRTLFNGVHLLPAGTTLRVPLDRRAPLCAERYWDYEFVEPDAAMDRQDYVEELDRLFAQAVSRQLISDVPVGTYLSGGMDTGAITAVASRQLSPMTSFTIGFDLSSASGLELGFDERAKAERLSYLCNELLHSTWPQTNATENGVGIAGAFPELADIIDAGIAEHRAMGADAPDDLLTRMIRAEEPDGSKLSDVHIRTLSVNSGADISGWRS